jgi:hypothetical protein
MLGRIHEELQHVPGAFVSDAWQYQLLMRCHSYLLLQTVLTEVHYELIDEPGGFMSNAWQFQLGPGKLVLVVIYINA